MYHRKYYPKLYFKGRNLKCHPQPLDTQINPLGVMFADPPNRSVTHRHSVSAKGEDMHFKRNSGSGQCHCHLQAVFHRDDIIFSSMPQECGRGLGIHMLIQAKPVVCISAFFICADIFDGANMGKFIGGNDRILEYFK